MHDERRDVKAIFCEAREKISPEERAAFLDRVCEDDAPLRQRVEALLQADGRAGKFLGDVEPAATLPPDSPLAEGTGTAIGRYKLLQQIGEGGFGMVFMAEQQEPVRRMVALKIIKPGMDSRAVVARFEAERQALALMDHPNIAHVFDGGVTDSGRPYFVMELVKGVPITAFCDKNHSPTEERLRLFVDVCRAVQHAHQKGVIHRDLKPSNIMVTLHDGVPVAKVIDFGVAKALNQRLTERTLFTAYGQMVGTPAYMSPEQAEMSGLDVDTRSDIYSLGVLLYELLTGCTPLEVALLREAGYAEMQRIIWETEPLRPSVRLSTSGQRLTEIAQQRSIDPNGLRRLMRGELDWITMKALEKDRRRRYETATAFAADIERFLHDEPVEAGPPTAGYRMRKFVRRNKGPVVSAALVMLASLIATATLCIGFAFALREKNRTESILDKLRVLLLDRAIMYAMSGDVERTESAVKDAEESKIKDWWGELAIGLAHSWKGDKDAARQHLSCAKDRAPNNCAVHDAYAALLLGHVSMMDSIERVTRVLRGEVPDRVPVGLHCYLMACQMHGSRFDEILRDGEALAEAQLQAWRAFGHDVIMLENGVCAEAEALGCAIRYTADGPPHVEEPLVRELDDLERLRVPDPERTFPLTELLKTTRILKRETGGKVFINGRSDQGPIALACALTGPEQFLTMLMDPEREAWCHKLVAFCSRVNVALGEAQRRAGADSSTIGLAGTSLISPSLFDAFELPGAQVFCAALKRTGGFAFVHACGDETHLLANLLATGADCLELDARTDAATCKHAIQGRASVLGMIDPVQVMRNGTPAAVHQQACRMLAMMGPGGGFIIGPGCALPADTPEENVQALMECVRREGIYSADGRPLAE